jgi:hypothetical protein
MAASGDGGDGDLAGGDCGGTDRHSDRWSAAMSLNEPTQALRLKCWPKEPTPEEITADVIKRQRWQRMEARLEPVMRFIMLLGIVVLPLVIVLVLIATIILISEALR